MNPNISQNIPKKSFKRIPTLIATEAKAAFLQGMTIAEICRLYPDYSYEQFRHLRETEQWDVLKASFEQELTESIYNECGAAQAKLKKAIIHLGNQVYDSVVQGKLRVDSVRDVMVVCELIGLVQDKKQQGHKPREYTPEEMDRVLDVILLAKGIPDSPVKDDE